MGYIRGKRNLACVDCLDWLGRMGIHATVGHTERSREKKLYVYCHDPTEITRVPPKFGEWELVARDQKEADKLCRRELKRMRGE